MPGSPCSCFLCLPDVVWTFSHGNRYWLELYFEFSRQVWYKRKHSCYRKSSQAKRCSLQQFDVTWPWVSQQGPQAPQSWAETPWSPESWPQNPRPSLPIHVEWCWVTLGDIPGDMRADIYSPQVGYRQQTKDFTPVQLRWRATHRTMGDSKAATPPWRTETEPGFGHRDHLTQAECSG